MSEVDYAAEFEQEEGKIKARFLEEIDRLIGGAGKAGRPIKGEANSNAVGSYRHYAEILNVQPSFISEVRSGRYKVNTRTLWVTKKCFPAFDVEYVLFGIRSTINPGTAAAPRSLPVSDSAGTGIS